MRKARHINAVAAELDMAIGNQSRRAAFTLVELLVVMGIIAILVAILMPALRRARNAAITANCLSNMKQCYLELRMYANTNKDRVPIGYIFSDKRLAGNTWMATGSASPSYNPANQPYQYGAWTGIGWLYNGGFMKNPRVWWDPQTVPNVSFSTRTTSFSAPSVVCWPPGNWGTTTYPSWSNQSTSVGYRTRPHMNWSNWDPTTATLPKATCPKFSTLKSAALISESMHIKNWEQLPHGRGMNVCYSDGSAQWIDGSAFMNNMLLGQTTPNTYILSGTYPMATGVWGDFDKRP